MAQVQHPVIDGHVVNVPDGSLNEWTAAGWVEVQPDNNNAGNPGKEE